MAGAVVVFEQVDPQQLSVEEAADELVAVAGELSAGSQESEG